MWLAQIGKEHIEEIENPELAIERVKELYKAKGYPERQNLRDHMTTLELIFTQLGEEMTRKLAVEQKAIGFDENSKAAKQGGWAAGDACRAAEKRTGVKVVSPDNFLNQIEEAKQKMIDENREE